METKLTLYHGTNCNFSSIDLSKSKEKRDFGKGFYLTTLQSQAKEWAEILFTRYGGDGVFVYEFEFDLIDSLSIKQFDGVSEDWLIFIRDNRVKGGTQHDFDVIRGAVANDKTNRTLALFVEGIYTLHGVKVMNFTTRDLTDVRKFFSEAWCKACREKSAETIVADYELISEGSNFNK